MPKPSLYPDLQEKFANNLRGVIDAVYKSNEDGIVILRKDEENWQLIKKESLDFKAFDKKRGSYYVFRGNPARMTKRNITQTL